MALTFKKYESESFATLGTLASLLGAKTKVRLNAKAFVNTDRVSIIAMKPDGTSARILCSKGISASVRRAHNADVKDQDILKALVKLEVSELEMKNKDGETELVPWLIAPAGEFAELEMWSVETLAKGKSVTYEELVAF